MTWHVHIAKMNPMFFRLALIPLLTAASCFAALDYIELSDRTDVLAGKSFGIVGPYERLVGKAYFLVDPKSPANAIIADVDKAPRNEKGMVAFAADLYVLNFEVSNRGGKGMVGTFDRAGGSTDPKTDKDLGDEYLLQQGYTIVWLGWQFDVPNNPGLMRLYSPIATDDGKPITGLVRAEFTPDQRTDTMPVADRNHRAYEIMNPDDPNLQLTVRDTPAGPRTVLPRKDWIVRDGKIRREQGFAPGKLYEIVFTSRNPPVAGLGSAAIRDLISFLKYNGVARDSVLGDQYRILKGAYGFGQSQSGRFLRKFVYDGFNADEKGRKVFDGVMAHVAGGGRGSFNERFAQPSRDGHPFLNTMYPVDLFPFTDLDETDAVTGQTGGLLDRAVKANAVPKIFYTNTSYEYWGRDAALIHVSPDGKSDMPLPDTTRIYFFAGGQHGPAGFPPPQNNTQNSSNPNDYKWALRALLTAMDTWVRDGKEPPESVYPKVAQLVAPDAVKFPKIPGVNFPLHPTTAYRMDLSVVPAKVGEPFPALVPQCDEDGIDLGGIRMPEVAVPLATYTGWNLRSPKIGAPDQLFSMQGSWVPFPMDKDQREAKRDPRKSIAQRYPNREAYLGQVRESARQLVKAGFLLEGDVDPVVERSITEWTYLHR
jgi:Alpha/beta hydrolase domain